MKTIFIASWLFLNLFCLNAQNKLERKLLKAIKHEQSFNGAQVGVTLMDLENKKKLVAIHKKKNSSCFFRKTHY